MFLRPLKAALASKSCKSPTQTSEYKVLQKGCVRWIEPQLLVSSFRGRPFNLLGFISSLPALHLAVSLAALRPKRGPWPLTVRRTSPLSVSDHMVHVIVHRPVHRTEAASNANIHPGPLEGPAIATTAWRRSGPHQQRAPSLP